MALIKYRAAFSFGTELIRVPKAQKIHCKREKQYNTGTKGNINVCFPNR